ncbi:uncharacterized membrane protein YgaE (UPF0421/DUF939 family) [Nocardioides luteus]|uniref:FUSC family protein n=1 Tax=Nocardioides luteus TaxID=1844 RepID=A0ABQ5T1Y3_9ACTN|nr:hypothetical protein [Nocardioides luteus]MDR7310350.1 uncharacterized membrane protein YgaE (UPF0421/DUF939 family) [Nocardioides luteus]GGR53270.1 hypothetical protein GCM10010197_19540 [Nocardioides luteus]GLJ69870.1 hypothetical protein GCM10017579_39060 [Nocardioides luteus]
MSSLRERARQLPWGLAVTAAIAGAIAYWVGLVIPGPAGQFPYYAPLGAVVAMSSTVMGSVRVSVQSVVSIWLGSAIALVVGLVEAPIEVTVAAVIGLGMLATAWQWLGASGTWVPTAALFVLIIGAEDPMAFVSAYGGLTLIGAVIGVVMTALFPQLPLSAAERAIEDVRTAVVVQLRQLAGALGGGNPPTQVEWAERRAQIEPAVHHMRTEREHVREASRGNRRRVHYEERMATQLDQAENLERISFLVEDLAQVLEEDERAENEVVGLGPQLRPQAGRALLALADLVEEGDVRTADTEVVDTARRALEDLADQIRDLRSRATPDEEYFTAGSIVTSIRRCLEIPDPA